MYFKTFGVVNIHESLCGAGIRYVCQLYYIIITLVCLLYLHCYTASARMCENIENVEKSWIFNFFFENSLSTFLKITKVKV